MTKHNPKNKKTELNDGGESMMTDEQYAEVERRVQAYEAGEVKMISWKKLKAQILKKHKQKLKESKPK